MKVDPVGQRRGDETVACPDCDLLQLLPESPGAGRARCARCGHILATYSHDPIDRPLALTITALLVLIIANTLPLMGISAVGHHANTTIIGGAYQMWVEGQELTALIVAFCAVLAPLGFLLSMLAVLLAARRPPAPSWVGEVMRWAEGMQPWSMIEVMMLGILVALIKIAELATVEPGIGMYATGALVVLIPWIVVSFEPGEIWQRIEWADGEAPPKADPDLPAGQPG